MLKSGFKLSISIFLKPSYQFCQQGSQQMKSQITQGASKFTKLRQYCDQIWYKKDIDQIIVNDYKYQIRQMTFQDLIIMNFELMPCLNKDSINPAKMYNKEYILCYLERNLKCLKEQLNQEVSNEEELRQNIFQYLKSLKGLEVNIDLNKLQGNICTLIFQTIEEYFLNYHISNSYEIDFNDKKDPFLVSLIKTNKIQQKWKEQEDTKIKLSFKQVAVDEQYLLYLKAVMLEFQSNNRGTAYFYYVIIEVIKNNIQLLKIQDQIDFIFHLTQYDKQFMIKQSLEQIDFSSIKQLSSEQQFTASIQLLWYQVISFQNILDVNSLITTITENMTFVKNLDQQMCNALYMIGCILKYEFIDLYQEFLEPDVEQYLLSQSRMYWNRRLDSNSVIQQDLDKYLIKQKYIYEDVNLFGINFKYGFKNDKSIVIAISKPMFLGNTNQQVLEVSLLKRIIRFMEYKIRFVDEHEYLESETRWQKNQYLQNKLKNLPKEEIIKKDFYTY